MARPKKSAPAKAPVSAAAEVVEAVKETVATKKAAVQKVEEVYLQAGGCEWNVSDCKERAVAAFVADGHKASSVKKLVIYLKPEEGKAYYVINDSENGSVEL
ncbi:MAG: hypothetical protein HFF72_00100 [Oscillospiraceae bacterium]|jgi:hypothetical protein|nr:hypothetical protein [Oscillospiraceae bacterium]MCI8721590.1 hypothetical protein [Oscillospiraceae bacterium]